MRIIASLAFVVLSPMVAAGAAAADYGSIKSLLLEAIDAPDGTARGVIVGPIARQFGTATGSTAPVAVDVTTLKRFNQQGCRRLNVSLKQANVPTQEGKLAEFGIDYQLNLCRDGSPPVEEIR